MKGFLKSPRYRNTLIGSVSLYGAIALFVALLLLFGFSGSLPSEIPSETTELPTTAPEIFEPLPNLYGVEDFAYEGQYMACLSGDYSLGIDVSQYQQEVDWQQVKNAGFSFVFIRVGGRYGNDGSLYPDDLCQQHYAGAKAAGLKIGAYFFSQAINAQEAKEEALYALTQIADWELDLPLAYDWEHINESTRTNGMDAQTLTECVLAFCQTVEDHGLDTMLYTNAHYSDVGFDFEKLQHIPVWLAMYSNEMTYPYRIAAWQYTNQGSVPGIAGNVDIDLYFLPLPI